MGGAVVKYTVTAKEKESSSQTAVESSEWKRMPSNDEARMKFFNDGTLPKHSDTNLLELRIMLEETYSLNAIGKCAESFQSLEIFSCWIEIQEYKSILADSYRRSKALHIYYKYIKVGSPQEIGDIPPELRASIKKQLDASLLDPEILHAGFYDKIQSKCFRAIYNNIYLPFKASTAYIELTKQLHQKYNRVTVDDFDYFDKLGEGGFGFVVYCRKKSTGKHYAMKIQPKQGLIDSFREDPTRADFEKQAFASCQHPFIVKLDYAFQTPNVAIMVLELSTAGDLARALYNSPEDYLSNDRVRFYAAEIVLALSYLHQKGLIYRDLKPNNILLNDDGHIQLVDLGGVADHSGRVLGQYNEVRDLLPLFVQSFQINNNNIRGSGEREQTVNSVVDERVIDPQFHSADNITSTEPLDYCSNCNNEDLLQRKRKLSVMGTFGYMAPEVVVMMSQNSEEKTGYTYAVDWWSLGVTMYKLLTGIRPFTDENFSKFVDMCSTLGEKVYEHRFQPNYVTLFQEIEFPSHVSKDAKDLIKRLLDVNENTRIGSGSEGVHDIKNHPYFDSINWELLEQKHVVPPYKPEYSSLVRDSVPHADFQAMMVANGKSSWLSQIIPEESQQAFAYWNFTSPNTIRIESGLAHAMDQFDKSFKVQQIMGRTSKYNNNIPTGNYSNNVLQSSHSSNSSVSTTGSGNSGGKAMKLQLRP